MIKKVKQIAQVLSSDKKEIKRLTESYQDNSLEVIVIEIGVEQSPCENNCWESDTLFYHSFYEVI